MIKLKNLLEKSMIAGIHDKKETLVVLRDMLRHYSVKSKIEWASYSDKFAHYDFDRDIIYISTSMNKDNKQFLISICHEIKHAMDRKKFGGGDQYREKYEMEQVHHLHHQSQLQGRQSRWQLRLGELPNSRLQ